MSTQLAVVPPQTNTQLTTLDDVMRLGDVFAKSGYFSDAKDAARAVVKILAGQDMGLSPFAAMNGIYLNSQGKLGYTSNLIAAKIKSSGRYDYKITVWTDDDCEIEFYERGVLMGPPAKFGKADAARAGLLNKDTYKGYPKGLYFSRALTQGARAYTPELFGGNAIYTPDEIEDTVPSATITSLRSVVTPQSMPEAVVLIDDATAAAIIELWQDFGGMRKGQRIPLETFIAEKGYSDLYSMPQNDAAKILDWLRERQQAAAQATPKGKFDGWACGASLAVELLKTCDEAEKVLALDESQVKALLFRSLGLPIGSRKELTPQQAQDGIDHLRTEIKEATQPVSESQAAIAAQKPLRQPRQAA